MNMHRTLASVTSDVRKSRGFTLVELMVALLLGLIVIAGVSSVFLANLRSYHSNTALSQVQSNARIAFELMARDIRQAGLTGCNSTNAFVANVLNNGPNGGAAQDWWANWNNAVSGYDAAQADDAITAAMPARAASTDSLRLMEASGEGLSVDTADQPAAKIVLNPNGLNANLATGDVVIVCDPDHATLVQVTNYDNNSRTLLHAANVAPLPGNCSIGLGYPTACTANGNPDNRFGLNAKVSKLAADDWYIGSHVVDGVTVRSLYRVALSYVNGVPTPEAQEMVRNVTDMQITYHQSGDPDFVDATAVTNWGLVDAVHVTLALQSGDQRAGTDDLPLTRTFASTTAIRNREATP